MPLTRTSSVPMTQVNDEYQRDGMSHHEPLRASSKQWAGSQWLVNMVILCPKFCKPTAASMTRRSAPPMPRSGWKKTMLLDGFVAINQSIKKSIHFLRIQLSRRSVRLEGALTSMPSAKSFGSADICMWMPRLSSQLRRGSETHYYFVLIMIFSSLPFSRDFLWTASCKPE